MVRFSGCGIVCSCLENGLDRETTLHPEWQTVPWAICTA